LRKGEVDLKSGGDGERRRSSVSLVKGGREIEEAISTGFLSGTALVRADMKSTSVLIEMRMSIHGLQESSEFIESTVIG